MGDPAGIGPEVVLGAIARDEALRASARFVIYGLNEILAYTADQLELPCAWHRVPHDSPRTGYPIDDPMLVRDFDEFDGLLDGPRRPTRTGGLASKAFVEEAVADALRPRDDPRHVDAIVTAPISKAAWHQAGYRWPGHTELLQQRTRAKRSVMAFTSPKLRVALATAHVPLATVVDHLTIGRVFDPIDLGHQACLDLGIARPRIAVTGLNPHAGENGAIGVDEQRVIMPAIEMARTHGIDAHGPFPADTIFIDAARGRWDLVVAMYHDQGLIPIKLLAWESAVNWTLGLPIIRTSPDHGTAFDIAGKQRADASSMRAAIDLAATLARRRCRAAESA